MTQPEVRGRGLIWALIALCALVEITLFLADQGFLGSDRLRQTAYEWGGFWPGLLQGWSANYPGQPVAMFFTYGFLHGGPVHLIVNMVTLWSLGYAVLERVGLWGFMALYGASLLGGAMGFGLIAETFRPMVGASGALFGLAGGLLAWNYVDRFTFREGLWPVVRLVAFLVAMNVAMWWALDGQLAWETHLGGFIVGWLAALLIDPRSRETT
ncbi:rhomboid family intramembrane serine protease [Jannaschia sp. CCS1]|uniref:rhomboid family intramembrane serine protease n=1 Tax=Jannaschia sp. (strain CCS1) TaxID=290400 RepID=UPI000053D78D|nr:rhomboid family intramembrane serine protease [Jannaschia sp. CCS1]ABD57149.1 Rhomboid-like protein [Jannaschia sp. CCS1]